MKKFLEFLASKGISDSDFKAKEPSEQAQIYTEYLESEVKAVNEGKASKDDLKNLQKQIDEFKENTKGFVSKELFNELDEAVKNLKDSQNGKIASKSLAEQLKEKTESIKAIAKGGNAEIVVKADTVRANITGNTQGYAEQGIGQLANRKLSAWDLFRKIPVSESNNQGVIKYWDWDSATTVRAAAAISEGAVFPESTAKFVEYTLPLQKVGDTLPVSEEFFEDEQMFAAELELFLSTNVDIKVDTDLINANGTAPNIKGILASVNAYTPVASGISDASIYDLLVKVKESITTDGASKYSPDFVFMNISDINKMKLKKDANKNYVIPPFVDRNGKQVDGLLVIENNAITANSLVLGDSRYARIYYKPGVELSKGYTGTQFTEDMMTLKARRRFAFLIRNADKGGFAKVTSISAALITLAS